MVAACGRKGWGHAEISQRCLNKFRCKKDYNMLLYIYILCILYTYSVFCFPEPSSDSLQTVYTSHLFTALAADKFSDALLKNIPNIVSCVLFMFQEITSNLKQSPNKPLFTFCIRDLSKVLQ